MVVLTTAEVTTLLTAGSPPSLVRRSSRSGPGAVEVGMGPSCRAVHDEHPPRRVSRTVLLVNASGAAVSAVLGVVGVARPDHVRPGSAATPLTRFWSASSAVRTAAVTVPLLQALVRRRSGALTLLTVAGLVQLGDGALGIWQRKPDMAAVPAVMGLVHLLSARHVRQARCQGARSA